MARNTDLELRAWEIKGKCINPDSERDKMNKGKIQEEREIVRKKNAHRLCHFYSGVFWECAVSYAGCKIMSPPPLGTTSKKR